VTTVLVVQVTSREESVVNPQPHDTIELSWT
jgi:hypothetical protein